MAQKAVVWNRFFAGWSDDVKVGPKGSFAFSQAFDFRKSPGQMSVLPQMEREDNGIVTDLIMNTIMAKDGKIFAQGNSGRFYQRTTAAVWTLESVLASGGVGLDIRQDADMLLAASQKTVSRYMPLSGVPQMAIDAYGPSYSTYNNTDVADATGVNLAAFQEGGVETYVPPTAIAEGNTTSRFFQSDIEPFVTISIYVVSKGSGDWTVTLHDGLNNVLATATITNANLNENAFNDFTFSSQVRAYVTPNARTYHVHVTSTVADGTLACSTANDLSTSDLKVWADRLVQTVNGYHQIVRFLQYECIANGNYLSAWEPLNIESPSNAEWQRHRLAFPMEYEMIGLATTNEFLVMALAKTSTSSTSDRQEGFLAYWSGLSPTYDFLVPIPEGAPQGLYTYKNTVRYYAGGAWWAKASPVTEPVKLRSMPGSDTEYYGSDTPITVHPYAAAVRRGIHLFAWPSVVTNTDIAFGIYSWGQTNKNYPESFGYNYIIDSWAQYYTAQNNLQLGGIWAYGDLLLLSRRDDDNGSYGICSVTNASVPAGTAIWDSLIVDNNYPNKMQDALYVDAYYDLPSGAVLTLKYKLDREADWHESEQFSTTNLWDGQTGYARLNVEQVDARCREMQMQIVIECDDTVTEPPVVYCASLVYDDLAQEALK